MGNNQISKKGSTGRTAGLRLIRTALACVFFIVSGCLDSAEDGLEPVGYHGEDSSNEKITVHHDIASGRLMHGCRTYRVGT